MLLVTLRTVIHVIILRYKYGMHVSVSEVLDLLRGQSNDKATSMDGLSGESLNLLTLFWLFYYLFALLVCSNTVIFQVVCSTQL